MKVFALLFATAVLASGYPYPGYQYGEGPYSSSMWSRLSGYKTYPYSHEYKYPTVGAHFYKPEEYMTKWHGLQNYPAIIQKQHDFDFEQFFKHFEYLGEHEKLVFFKNLLAVDITQRVLEQRQFTKQTVGSTYAQALAVAAAQQAFDECEKHGKPIFQQTCWTVAEHIVQKVIDEAEFGQFFGSGSLYINSVAVDAANRALAYVEHYGIDITNKFVRAVAIAVAQQALDEHERMGHDIGSNDARTFAVAAAQEVLEHMFYKKFETVHGYLNKFFGRYERMPVYNGLYYSLFGKYYNWDQTFPVGQYKNVEQFPQFFHGLNKDMYKSWYPYTKFYGLWTPTEFEYLNTYHHFYPYYPTQTTGLTVPKNFQKTYFGVNADEKYYKDVDYKYQGKYDYTNFLKTYFGGIHGYDYNMYPTTGINYEKTHYPTYYHQSAYPTSYYHQSWYPSYYQQYQQYQQYPQQYHY